MVHETWVLGCLACSGVQVDERVGMHVGCNWPGGRRDYSSCTANRGSRPVTTIACSDANTSTLRQPYLTSADIFSLSSQIKYMPCCVPVFQDEPVPEDEAAAAAEADKGAAPQCTSRPAAVHCLIGAPDGYKSWEDFYLQAVQPLFARSAVLQGALALMEKHARHWVRDR